MSDLVPYRPLLPSKQQRELARVNQRTEAALAEQHGNAALLDDRIDVGIRMGERYVMRANGLHRLITAVSQDDPGQELHFRAVEELIGLGVGFAIKRYIETGRL